MSTSNARIAQLMQATRRHRWRWWLALVVQGATPLVIALTSCLLAFIIAAQLIAIPYRRYWVCAMVFCWVFSVALMCVWRVRHLPSIWRRLDRAYGWQSALATAVCFANSSTSLVLADAQYDATLHLITTTPARQLRLWPPRLGLVLGGLCALLLGAWWLPTPFDQQIAQQRQFAQLAQSVAQTLQQLPPLVPIDVASVANSPDPQTLVAQLNVTAAQVAAQAQQSQQLQRLIPQLQQAAPAQQQALLSAAQSTLGAPQTAALQRAVTQAQQGNPAPLQTLADQAQRQSQAANQWQQALADAKNQTLAQSQSGAPTSQSPTNSAPARTDANGSSARQNGASTSQNGSSTSQNGASTSQNGASTSQN
ncbi:MAG: hypothetical protein EBS29_02550, partial [Chloroflexia bacterium]|nr:hypothetical protein [Chloroflexia bacterium]